MQPSDSVREEGSAGLDPEGSLGEAPITVEDRAQDGEGDTDVAGDGLTTPEPPTEPEPPQHPGDPADGPSAEATSETTDDAEDDPGVADGEAASSEAPDDETSPEPTGDDTAGDETADVADEATVDETAEADDSTDGEATSSDADTKTEGDTDTKAEGDTDTKAEGDTDTKAEGDTDAKTEGDTDQTVVSPAPSPIADATAPTDRPRPARDRSGRRPILLAVATVVGLYALLAVAWAVDAATHQDQVMRGVAIDGLDVGGDDRDELAAAVTTLTERLADEDLEVAVGDVTVTTDPVTLGAVIDGTAVTDEALAARRGGFLPFRPITWATGFFSTTDVPLRYTVDPTMARQGIASVVEPALEAPVEPQLEVDGGELTVAPGSVGVAVDPQLVIDGLPAAVDGDAPHRLELPEEVAEPTIDEAALSDLAADLNESTGQPIAVQVLDKRVQVSPATQRAWIRLETDGDDLDWSIDEEAALADLHPLFPALGSEDQQARFEVVDDKPIIIPASETVICCAEGSGPVLASTIERPIPAVATTAGEDEGDTAADDGDEEPELRVANLDPETTGFDEGVAELESLGIIEQVSTFTTEHACCQNRVTNIHRIADLTQGVIIRPGEEFSLNGFVGRRTRENGFVADGAIAQGNFEQQVGGGISQFATTFFNASFFAGVEFLEYQSHSIYISRYPRGREATISWPKPDLKIRNNTPYGILVWNEYTDRSITVSFYSTKHLEVEALPLLRSSDRQCRIDITPREITHEDGTVTEDRVRAIYRPGEGLDCNGNSTTPDDAPKPASKPAPTPTPEPTPDPDPAPPAGGDTGTGGAGGDGEVLPAG